MDGAKNRGAVPLRPRPKQRQTFGAYGVRLKKKKGVWLDGKHVPKIGDAPTSKAEVNPANLSRPIPREISLGFGRTYSLSGGVWLKDTANTIFAGDLGEGNGWVRVTLPYLQTAFLFMPLP